VIADFALDQPREEAENAIGYVLQTPEAYLEANGVTMNLSPSSQKQSPVDLHLPKRACIESRYEEMMCKPRSFPL